MKTENSVVQEFDIELKGQTNYAKTYSIEAFNNESKLLHLIAFGLDRFTDVLKALLLDDESLVLINSRGNQVIPCYSWLNIVTFDSKILQKGRSRLLIASVRLAPSRLGFKIENALNYFDELYLIDTNQPKFTKEQIYLCIPYKIHKDPHSW